MAESAAHFDAEDDELAAMGLDKLWLGSFLGTPGICQRGPRESALSATGLTGRSEGRDEGGINCYLGPVIQWQTSGDNFNSSLIKAVE